MVIRKDLFMYTINQLRNGETVEELSEKLNELVNACRDTNKGGELVLKISMKPNGVGRYFLTDDIKSKVPKLPKNSTLLWGTPEGNLQKTDPDQAELDLRQVNEVFQQPKAIPQDATAAKFVA